MKEVDKINKIVKKVIKRKISPNKNFLQAGIDSLDLTTIFLTIEVEGVQEAHFARGYAGFVTAVGYLSMRFLYSSSKVQIGTVVMYIVCVMAISKIFSFIYDGYTPMGVATFFIGIVFALGLYIVQKARKNQLDYNL